MTLRPVFYLGCIAAFLLIGCAAIPVISTPKNQFITYAFVPYASYKTSDSTIIHTRPPQSYFDQLGIHSIYLIYEGRLLDYPQNDTAHGVVNPDKLNTITALTAQNPQVPVSLDLEGWGDFNAATPGLLTATILAFKQLNPNSQVGLYSTVPQNSYHWSDANQTKWNSWNEKYATVAATVDYYSPSLYNYSLHDFESWRTGAIHNIQAARAYNPNKLIIAYITPEVSEGGATTWLSYDEMMERLQTLLALGANGCVIWASSGSRDALGQAPVLDATTGWLKAVADFNQSEGFPRFSDPGTF